MRPNRPKTLCKILILAAYCGLALLVFWPALKADFVFDDARVVVENPFIRSPASIPEMFARAFSGSAYIMRPGGRIGVDPGYRPMRFVSYTLDYQFDQLNPFVFHLSNLLHHALAAFMLYLLLRHFGLQNIAAFLGGLIFLLHPVNSEPACYITGRKDILCAIFYMASFICYIRWRRRMGWPYAVAAFALFLAAFFCKEMALTLPFALLLWEAVRRRRLRGILRPLKLIAPLAALSLALLLLQLNFKNLSRVEGVSVAWWGGSVLSNMLTIPRLILFYIRLALVPFPLSADYSHNAFPASGGLLSPPWTLVAAVLLAAVVAFGFYAWRRRWSAIAFSVFFFLGALVPVSQIYPLPVRVADRFLYIPLLAFAFLVAFFLRHRLKRVAVLVAVCSVCTLYGVLDFTRSHDWKNDFTLFSSVLRFYPDCALAHVAVGSELLNRKEPEKALTHFRRAEQILKTAPKGPYNHGLLLQARYYTAETLIALGRKKEAASILKKLLLERDAFGRRIIDQWLYLHIPFNLAAIMLERNLPETAWELYGIVVRLARGHTNHPKIRAHYVLALHKMAILASRKGAHSEAARLLKEALKAAINTDHEPPLHLYLAQTLIKAGEPEKAIQEAETAEEKARSYMTRKITFKPLTDKPVSEETIRRVLQQAPVVKAWALRALGAVEAAVDLLRKTLRENFSEWAVCELARSLLVLERPEEAETVLEAALQRIGKPKRPELFDLLVEARRQVRRRDPHYIKRRIKSALTAAKSLYAAGRKKQAHQILKKALRLAANLTPQTRGVWLHLAEAHLLMLATGQNPPRPQDLKEAERLIRLAAKEGSDVSVLWAAVGDMWGEIGEVDEAVEALVESGLPRARFKAAMMLLEAGRNEAALSQLKKCVETGYRRADALYHLAMLLARMGRYREAAASMRRFLKIAEPADPRRALLKTLLESDPRLGGKNEKKGP